MVSTSTIRCTARPAMSTGFSKARGQEICRYSNFEVSAHHQPQDRQGPRPHDSAVAAGPGGSGDRLMDRRRFLLTSLAGALATPIAARAQPTGKVWHIGYLGLGARGSDPSGIEGLGQGLRELGYVENQNIVIEYRYADDKPDRL